eukprot:Sspe_Gene.100446::Locus_75156_Transcript_1_1_Confidence_1.000_Length_466::g.100446::m.100446
MPAKKGGRKASAAKPTSAAAGSVVWYVKHDKEGANSDPNAWSIYSATHTDTIEAAYSAGEPMADLGSAVVLFRSMVQRTKDDVDEEFSVRRVALGSNSILAKKRQVARPASDTEEEDSAPKPATKRKRSASVKGSPVK